jgi:hypothetical protein
MGASRGDLMTYLYETPIGFSEYRSLASVNFSPSREHSERLDNALSRFFTAISGFLFQTYSGSLTHGLLVSTLELHALCMILPEFFVFSRLTHRFA